ncbi:MAG: MerR family transcriptional regulator [Clostridiaceae bacterium]|nr:MerR family transcriptional regulator [Clostridiaceae bacterium]
MYSVKQVAEIMEMTEHAIRFYTDKGLLPCQRDSNNRRIFDDESLNWLLGIKCLKRCGVSIEDIKVYSDLCLKGDTTLEERYQFMVEQQKIAYQHLKEAQELVKYMDHKVQHYEDIMASRVPDDTNPATQIIPPCNT